MRSEENADLGAVLLSHVGLIRHIGRRRLRESSALDDFTQEVLTRAIAYRARIGDSRAVRKWLPVIARNTATDWNRKRRASLVDEPPEVATETTAAHAVENAERWEALIDALTALDPTDRDIVYRRYFQDESYDELASRHGLSAEAIGFRLHRSRRRLRRRLEAALASLGLVWGMRSRAAAGGALIMKTGHGTAVGIAVALAIIALGVGGMVELLSRRSQQAGEAARAEASETRVRKRTYGLARSRSEQGAAHAGTAPAQVQAAGVETSGATPDAVRTPVTPASAAANSKTPQEEAQAALNDMMNALQNFDPRVDADALIDRSAGEAREFFHAMKREFSSGQPIRGIESELEEVRAVQLVGQSFVDGELRAVVHGQGGSPFTMTLRQIGDAWKVVAIGVPSQS